MYCIVNCRNVSKHVRKRRRNMYNHTQQRRRLETKDRPALSSQRSLDGSHIQIHRLKSGREPQDGLDTSKDWLIDRHLYNDFVYVGLKWHVSPLIEWLFKVPTRKLALRMKTLPRSPCVKTESCASLSLLCDQRRIEGWVYKLIGLKGRWKYWRITKVCNYSHL